MVNAPALRSGERLQLGAPNREKALVGSTPTTGINTFSELRKHEAC